MCLSYRFSAACMLLRVSGKRVHQARSRDRAQRMSCLFQPDKIVASPFLCTLVMTVARQLRAIRVSKVVNAELPDVTSKSMCVFLLRSD